LRLGGLARDEVKRELRQLFVAAYLLEEFASLNYEGFIKILKKHDKQMTAVFATHDPTSLLLRDRYTALLAARHFNNADGLHALKRRLTDRYAELFEEGNRRKAAADLQEAIQQDPRCQPRVVRPSLLEK